MIIHSHNPRQTAAQRHTLRGTRTEAHGVKMPLPIEPGA